MGAHCAPLRKKKSSAVPHISERSHIGNLRQAIHGKGVILKRVETAGVYPLVRPRGVSAHFVRFSSGGYIIIGIGKEKTLEISVQI